MDAAVSESSRQDLVGKLREIVDDGPAGRQLGRVPRGTKNAIVGDAEELARDTLVEWQLQLDQGVVLVARQLSFGLAYEERGIDEGDRRLAPGGGDHLREFFPGAGVRWRRGLLHR